MKKEVIDRSRDSPITIDRVAMESSTAVAPLYRQLASKGFDVLVSHPKKTRYIAEAKIKSDRVDSKAIAELARLDALPLEYMPDKEISMLREEVRSIDQAESLPC